MKTCRRQIGYSPMGVLLSPEELSEYLQVPIATLYAWRNRGVGPAAMKVGRHIRYRASDVETWLDEHRSVAS